MSFFDFINKKPEKKSEKSDKVVTSKKSSMAQMNYIWVGPPSNDHSDNVMAIPGHDIKDVLAMAKVCKNPIDFYCLDAHVNHYKKIFKDTNVKVQSIEKYVNKKKDQGKSPISDHAKKILEIKNEILSPSRMKVIDFVTLKDVFSLFLLSCQGGYTIDTNVHPKSGVMSLEMPSYTSFRAPVGALNPECWMMYASPTALNEPREMLVYYLKNWDDTQNILKKTTVSNDRYPEEYHKGMPALMIKSIEWGMLDADPDWKYSIFAGESRYVATCKGLPIEKTYGNTHKHKLIFEQNMEELKREKPPAHSSRLSNTAILEVNLSNVERVMSDDEKKKPKEKIDVIKKEVVKKTNPRKLITKSDKEGDIDNKDGKNITVTPRK